MKSKGIRSAALTGAAICILTLAFAIPRATAEVLLHAHFDNKTPNANFATGRPQALPVSQSYTLAATAESRWGRALSVTNPGANCTFNAARNFSSQRGTASLWFRIEKHEEGMYHPLFGWYRPPFEPVAKKRLSALEVYLHNKALTLGLYTPEYTGTSKPTEIEVGKWHHLEINWDCGRGAGKSVYNVFVDGKNIIRVIDGGALKDGKGAQLHLGVWDYGYSHILNGQIDELRITNQIEHSDEFDPPTVPYLAPQTIEYARATHRLANRRLKQLRTDIGHLSEFSAADISTFVRETLATANKLDNALVSLNPALNDKSTDVVALCQHVDNVADQLSVARLPLHRIMVAAAARAAAEDRRSLLFKDLNDELTGDAVVLNGKQLFIDDYIIENLNGARRSLNARLRKLDKAPAITDVAGPLLKSGAFLYDRRKKQFTMWYILEGKESRSPLLFLVTSKDGRNWERSDVRIPLTLSGHTAINERQLHQLDWFVHGKLANSHVVAASELDRFVAVEARNEGTLTTRPFIAIGDTLVVNANAGQGSIRVEAIDALGRVIRGFTEEECQPVTGDGINHRVAWKSGTNCHPLQARPIQLRFHLKNARLYSFEFQIRHNNFVPLSYRQ